MLRECTSCSTRGKATELHGEKSGDDNGTRMVIIKGDKAPRMRENNAPALEGGAEGLSSPRQTCRPISITSFEWAHGCWAVPFEKGLRTKATSSVLCGPSSLSVL